MKCMSQYLRIMSLKMRWPWIWATFGIQTYVTCKVCWKDFKYLELAVPQCASGMYKNTPKPWDQNLWGIMGGERCKTLATIESNELWPKVGEVWVCQT